mgnify:FL=1
MDVEKLLSDKEKEYGPAVENMKAIAATWTWFLRRKALLPDGVKLEADDVCIMMTLFKISREAGKRKPDFENYIDSAGYMSIGMQYLKSKEAK